MIDGFSFIAASSTPPARTSAKPLRKLRSRLGCTGTSTVSTSAPKPLSRARPTSASVTAPSFAAYIWNQVLFGAMRAASSIEALLPPDMMLGDVGLGRGLGQQQFAAAPLIEPDAAGRPYPGR